MGRKLFLGSVGTAEAFRRNPETKKLELMFVSKTLTDSSVNISITKDDLRAGTGAPIVASFYHDAAVEITLTDVMFKPEYVEAQLGAKFEANTGAYQSEEVETEGGSLVLSKAPIALNLGCGINSVNVWYTEKGKDNWRSFEGTFEKNSNTGTLEGLEKGTYCVRYYAKDDAARVAEVTANMIPEELYLIITAPLFAGDACSASNGKKAGQIQYEVPRFRLNGGQEFAMAMSSNQTINLSGSALAFDDGCDANDSKLLRIIEVIDGRKWYEDAKELIMDKNMLAEGDTVEVYAVYKNNTVAKIANKEINFDVTGDSNTCSKEGLLHVVNPGTLTATAIDNPKLKSEAYDLETA